MLARTASKLRSHGVRPWLCGGFLALALAILPAPAAAGRDHRSQQLQQKKLSATASARSQNLGQTLSLESLLSSWDFSPGAVGGGVGSFLNWTDFGPSSPTPRNISQGSLGNCWYLAGLAGLAKVAPQVLKDSFVSVQRAPTAKHKDRMVFKIRFFVDGFETLVAVDSLMPAAPEYGRASNGRDFYFSKVVQGDNVWPVVLEKAFAKLYQTYMRLEGGHPSDAFLAFTQAPATLLVKNGWKSREEKGDAEWEAFFKQKIIELVGKNYPVALASKANDVGVAQGHAFTILEADERTLTLYNPWGANDYQKVQRKLGGAFGGSGTQGDFKVPWEHANVAFDQLYWAELRPGYVSSAQTIHLQHFRAVKLFQFELREDGPATFKLTMAQSRWFKNTESHGCTFKKAPVPDLIVARVNEDMSVSDVAIGVADDDHWDSNLIIKYEAARRGRYVAWVQAEWPDAPWVEDINLVAYAPHKVEFEELSVSPRDKQQLLNLGRQLEIAAVAGDYPAGKLEGDRICDEYQITETQRCARTSGLAWECTGDGHTCSLSGLELSYDRGNTKRELKCYLPWGSYYSVDPMANWADMVCTRTSKAETASLRALMGEVPAKANGGGDTTGEEDVENPLFKELNEQLLGCSKLALGNVVFRRAEEARQYFGEGDRSIKLSFFESTKAAGGVWKKRLSGEGPPQEAVSPDELSCQDDEPAFDARAARLQAVRELFQRALAGEPGDQAALDDAIKAVDDDTDNYLREQLASEYQQATEKRERLRSPKVEAALVEALKRKLEDAMVVATRIAGGVKLAHVKEAQAQLVAAQDAVNAADTPELQAALESQLSALSERLLPRAAAALEAKAKELEEIRSKLAGAISSYNIEELSAAITVVERAGVQAILGDELREAKASKGQAEAACVGLKAPASDSPEALRGVLDRAVGRGARVNCLTLVEAVEDRLKNGGAKTPEVDPEAEAVLGELARCDLLGWDSVLFAAGDSIEGSKSWRAVSGGSFVLWLKGGTDLRISRSSRELNTFVRGFDRSQLSCASSEVRRFSREGCRAVDWAEAGYRTEHFKRVEDYRGAPSWRSESGEMRLWFRGTQWIAGVWADSNAYFRIFDEATLAQLRCTGDGGSALVEDRAEVGAVLLHRRAIQQFQDTHEFVHDQAAAAPASALLSVAADGRLRAAGGEQAQQARRQHRSLGGAQAQGYDCWANIKAQSRLAQIQSLCDKSGQNAAFAVECETPCSWVTQCNPAKTKALLDRLRDLDNWDSLISSGTDEMFPTSVESIGTGDCGDSATGKPSSACSLYDNWRDIAEVLGQAPNRGWP